MAEVRQCELGVTVPGIAKTGGKINIFSPESIAPNMQLDHEQDEETRPEKEGRTTEIHTVT